jgi:TRIAD3 protein (E3 ubiquitin-protein ligase RNF216)
MTCPNCRTASCYICRQIITGYEHFDQRRSTGNTPISSSKGTKKCVLWDKDLDAMHANEVRFVVLRDA